MADRLVMPWLKILTQVFNEAVFIGNSLAED